MQDLEFIIELSQFMGEFILKDVGVETELPKQTGIIGYAYNMGQTILTAGGLVLLKYFKASALFGISREVCFRDMRKGPEWFVNMSRHPVVGKIQDRQSLIVVPFTISTSDTAPRA